MDSKDSKYIVAASLLAFLAAAPLFHGGYPATHDGNYHYLRLVELDRSLRDGQLYARWLPDLAYGYGYPLFNFYPPLSFYVAELFHLLGFGVVDSLKLTYLLAFLLAAWAMYLLVRELLGREAALIAAASYTFAPYHLLDIYVRGTLAEFFSFIFYPLILWSLYKVSHSGRMRYVAAGSFSYAFLILTHNVMALVFTPIALAYSIFLISGKRDWVKARQLGGVFLLGAGMSALYWLPALFELQHIRATGLLNVYFDFHNHFVYPWQLFSRYWGFGYSVPGKGDGMSFQIGIPQALFSAASLFVLHWLGSRAEGSSSTARRHVAFFLLSASAFTFLTLSASAPLWEYVPFLEYAQFPWRHLGFVAFFTSFLSGSLMLLFKEKRRLGLALLGGLLILPSAPYLKANYIYVNESKWTPGAIAGSGYTATSCNDYAPASIIEMPKRLPKNRFSVISGDMDIALTEHKSTYYLFKTYARSDSRVRVENFWFPGWRAYADGAEVPVGHPNENGAIEVNVPSGTKELLIRFEATPPRRVGEAASILCLLLILAAIPISMKSARF